MKERLRMTKLGLAGGTMLLVGGAAAGWALHEGAQTEEAYNKDKQIFLATKDTDPKHKQLGEAMAKQKKMLDLDSHIANFGLMIGLTGALTLGADIFLSKPAKKTKINERAAAYTNTYDVDYRRIRESSWGKDIENVKPDSDYL